MNDNLKIDMIEIRKENKLNLINDKSQQEFFQ